MGAFETGFSMGKSMIQQVLDNKDREEQRKREAEESSLRMEGARLAIEQARRTADSDTQARDLMQQLTRPNAGNYTLGAPSPGGGTGLRMPADAPALPDSAPLPADLGGDFGGAPSANAQSAPAPAAPTRTAPTALAAGGLRMPAAGGGAGLQVAPGQGEATFRATPTRGDAEDLLGRIALLRGDTAGYRAAQANKRAMNEEDVFAKRLGEYKGTEDQVASTAAYLNNNSRRLTMGTPDKNGLVQLAVAKEDGTASFLNLSKQDQAKLYAAGHLLELNPTKALEMMAGVNKELAAAVAADNGLTANLASNSNDVAGKSATITHQANTDANDKRRTDATVASSGVMNKLHMAQLDELAQKTKDRKDLAAIHTELSTAIEAGDVKGEERARKKLMGFTVAGRNSNLSDIERRANFYLASGKAKTMEEAATMAHEKVQTSAKDDYMALMKPNSTGLMPSAKDMEPIMEAMHGANWKDKLAGTSAPKPAVTAPATALPLPAVKDRIVGKEYPTSRGPAIWRGTGWEVLAKP